MLKNLCEWLNDSTMFLKVGHYLSLSFIEPHRYIEMVCALRQAQEDRFVELFFREALCLV